MKASTDDQQIRQLVHDHYQAVYRFAYRLSGQPADAEDLTQQTFLTACDRLGQLRQPERARSWLFSIVRNDYLKSRSTQMVELPDLVEPVDPGEPSRWPDEFDEEHLQAVLNAMPEAFRSPVLLFYFEELSYREIAEVLELPAGTVMSRLSRGKAWLREQLQCHPEPTGASRSSP